MHLLDFERFASLASDADVTVVPVVAEVVADGLTPVVAAATLATEEGSFLLESVVGGEKWGRYSFVGFAPRVRVRGAGDRFEIHENGAWRRKTGDSYQGLREVLSEWRPPSPAALAPLKLPRFWGGAVGYFAYDIVRRFEPSVGAPRGDADELEYGLGATLVVFDALRQTLRVIVPVKLSADLRADYEAATMHIEDALARLRAPASLPRLPMPSKMPSTRGATQDTDLPASSFDRVEYEDAVRTCQEHIRAGDIFQVVLSQRFELDYDRDPLTLYRAMRVVNPSPYMFFVRASERTICGASPETLVRVEDGVATVRPIAGTRRRGTSDEDDRAHEEDLLADPKERAEHVMLVDLGRNDVGRISEPGSVRITEQMIVERFSHVMHMTSNIEGTLRDGKDALDVVRATFPAGTLSGAPKVRAMQIIDALEPVSRGLYGGAVGYLGFDGNADLAIAIRTAEIAKGRLALQAGAGIVEASDPGREYEETLHKARAGLVAIDAARRAHEDGP